MEASTTPRAPPRWRRRNQVISPVVFGDPAWFFRRGRLGRCPRSRLVRGPRAVVGRTIKEAGRGVSVGLDGRLCFKIIAHFRWRGERFSGDGANGGAPAASRYSPRLFDSLFQDLLLFSLVDLIRCSGSDRDHTTID